VTRSTLVCVLALSATVAFAITDLPIDSTIRGPAGGDLFGNTLAGPIDADGDGRPDVAVGNLPGTNPDAEVQLFRSGAAGLQNPAWDTINAVRANVGFGESLAAGDLNGDGRPDLIVSDPAWTANTGRVAVYHAAPGGMDDVVESALAGSAVDELYGVVLATGDVDGDGDDDLAIGVPRSEGTIGRVDVYWGSPTGIATAPDQVLRGAAVGEGMGNTLTFADVDGDGFADLIVGYDGTGGIDDAVRVFPGSAAGVANVATLELHGATVDNGFGRQLVRIGDADGDGTDDVAIWQGVDALGAVHLGVHPGSAAGMSATATVLIPTRDSMIDVRGAFCGSPDMNGDGLAELVLSEHSAGAGQSAVRVHFGTPGGVLVDPAWRTQGLSADELITRTACPGDINTDGLADILAASPGASNDRGELYVIFGRLDLDRDGYGVTGDPATDDCDDSDPALFQNLHGFPDADADGYGVPGGDIWACVLPAGYATNNDDCDDARADVNPGVEELCDVELVDEDCDGRANDDDRDLNPAVVPAWYQDDDNDGYGDILDLVASCSPVAGRIDVGGDCDDTRVRINPGAPETCDFYNRDEDCDGAADDADPSVDPAGKVSRFVDADLDGFGDPSTIVQICDPTDATIEDGSDCDDADPSINPLGTELCDAANVDEDCDGLINGADNSVDDGTFSTYYRDLDGDGFGDAESAIRACGVPEGFVEDRTDCTDRDGTWYPGAPDGLRSGDRDCDGVGCASTPRPASALTVAALALLGAWTRRARRAPSRAEG
jgi:hypothetical protein